MATGKSGSFAVVTSNANIAGTVSWSETYDVATNTSSVTVALKLRRTNDYSGNTTPGLASTFTLTCNGVAQTITKGASSFSIPPGGTNVTVASYTFTDIAHSTDGSKSVVIKVSGRMPNCGSAGTITISTQQGTATLQKIARLSTVAVSGTTLGSASTLTVTRQDNSYTHTITYKCGSAAAVTIATNDNATSYSFTADAALAAQNTQGMTVPIVFTITTYYNGTSLGSTTLTKIYNIPDYELTVHSYVSDPNGYKASYDVFLSTKSCLRIQTTVSDLNYATVKTCVVTMEGVSYNGQDITTNVISSGGPSVGFKVVVTDSRGKTETVNYTVNVAPYTAPAAEIKAERGDVNSSNVWVPNDEGGKVKIYLTLSAFEQNHQLKHRVQYGAATNSMTDDTAAWTNISNLITDTGNLVETTYTATLSVSSAWKIRVKVTDDFTTLTYSTIVDIAHVLMDWHASGKGLSFGEVATESGVTSSAYPIRHKGGFMRQILNNDVDLNTLLTPNRYASSTGRTYTHSPVGSGVSFSLEVIPSGVSIQVIQRLTTAHKTASVTWERHYYADAGADPAWGAWTKVAQMSPAVLWSGDNVMGDTNNVVETIQLSESIAVQPRGLLLIFKLTDAINHYQEFYVSKEQIALAANYHTFTMFSYTFRIAAIKLLKFEDITVNGVSVGKISGDINNDSSRATASSTSIAYDSSKMSLVKVLGV